MKQLVTIVFVANFILTGCGANPITSETTKAETLEQFNEFDSINHLQPLFDKSKFDTLHDFDLGWALLEPINLAKSREDDKELSKRFSAGQKALYFLWYLDEQVTNGGFVQFYLNGYREYIAPIKNGLKLIGDTAMLTLVENADKEYLQNQKVVDSYLQKKDWQPLYEKTFKFSLYDNIYYKNNKKMMHFIELYARKNVADFVKLK